MKVTAMQLLEEQGVEITVQVNTALNLFGVRMVHHVLKKPDTSRGIFESMHDIGHAFAVDVANLTGKDFKCGWTKSDDSSVSPGDKEKATALAPALKQWGENGEVDRAQLYKTHGLRVGVQVTHTKTKESYIIKEIDVGDKVVLEKGDEQVQVDSGAFLKAVASQSAEYNVTQIHDVPEFMEHWSSTANPGNSFAWKAMVEISNIQLALDRLAKEKNNDDLDQLLDIYLSPPSHAGVYAKVDISENGVTIVPLTMSVVFRESVPSKDVVALPKHLQSISGKKTTLILMKPKLCLPKEAKSVDKTRGAYEEGSQEGFVGHFWLVQEAADPKAANMSMYTKDNDEEIPVMSNHKAIKAGEKLSCCLKVTQRCIPVATTSRKRART